MSRKFIYGLVDPRPEKFGELRYVGQSSVNDSRPQALHKYKVGSWQKHIRSSGLREEWFIIEEWDGTGDWKTWLNDVEMFYIAYFKSLGADLTNLTNGGEGNKGWSPTSETRKNISAAKKGKSYLMSEDGSRRKSAAMKKPKTLKTRAKMAEARRLFWARKRGGACYVA